MLMKRIGRMKQKKGAVLFAVIAVMALLIAMASTAYYTARSAYNSVVSNYNYSQLYLSAISVSDMVSAAVANDPINSASGTGINNYQPLRDAVLSMETIGDKITASSQNISTPTATDEAILNQLASTDSVVAGILDGIKVEIELKNNADQYAPAVAGPGTDQYTFFFKYEYTFTTTAYYRNNTVTVQDAVMTVKSKIWTPDPGSPGTDPTDGTPGGGDGLFKRFFTSTGQVIGDNGGTDIVRTSRIVEIKAHQINDDAFYQNDHTFFVNGNNNTFLGSVTSTGSVYLDKFTTNIQSSGSDWYIGGDFVMLGSNANSFDLTNNGNYDNNLYVAGDMVLSGDGASVTATDIYVDGDLYIISHGSPQIDGNLHVTGNIYYQMGDTVIDENGNPVASPLANADAEGYPAKYDSADSYNTFSVTGDFDCNGQVILPAGSGASDTAQIKVNTDTSSQTVTIPNNGSASTAGNAIGTYNPDDVTVTVTNRIPNSDTDTFETVTEDMSVSDAIQQQAGENIEYANYTSPQTAYNNVINIDFDLLSGVDTDGDDSTDYYEYIGPNGLTIRTATSSLSSTVTVSIPYNEDGCALNIDALSISNMLGGNANIVYEINTTTPTGTAGTMPVVLLPNIFVDGNPDDTDTTADDPAFVWQGNNYNNNGSTAQVVAVGDGNVALELANYDPSTLTSVQVGETGTGQWEQNAEGEWYEVMAPVYAPSATYAPYNASNYATTASALYIAGYKEVVGNAAQIAVIGTDGNITDSKANSMLQPGTTTPYSQYENQFMLISNANNAIAIDMTRIQNTFCGFIYAPNGELNNKELAGGTNPVFGAMIVSTYRAGTSYIYYAEPKPSRVSAMTGVMEGGIAGGGTPGTPGTPPTAPPGTGTYSSPSHVDIWDVEGSNYVG